jgi:hypothetical protein
MEIKRGRGGKPAGHLSNVHLIAHASPGWNLAMLAASRLEFATAFLSTERRGA